MYPALFKKLTHTSHYPKVPMLVWDGDCKFCKFWKTRWELKTKGSIVFKTYQEIAQEFPDIPLKEFKKASRFIDDDGSIYSGPDSAYRTLFVSGNRFWHKLYRSQRWFERLSDHGYNHIAKNRSFYYKVTTALFGKNPQSLKHYWILYLLMAFLMIGWIFRYLV